MLFRRLLFQNIIRNKFIYVSVSDFRPFLSYIVVDQEITLSIRKALR